MKTKLKYILFVSLLTLSLSAVAQFAQQPSESMFQSTSTMMTSGSQLPQAAATGTVLAGSAASPYSPADFSGPRRALDPDDETDKPENWEDPNKTPVGPVPFAFMLLLAAGYGLYLRRRQQA